MLVNSDERVHSMKGTPEIERSIRYAVAEHYLKTGEASSVADIAQTLGWSLATVYRAIHRVDGMITGIMSYDEIGTVDTVPIMPNAQRLGPYFPAPYFLRELILENRIVTKSDDRERADMVIVRNGHGGHSDGTQRGHGPQPKEGHS